MCCCLNVRGVVEIDSGEESCIWKMEIVNHGCPSVAQLDVINVHECCVINLPSRMVEGREIWWGGWEEENSLMTAFLTGRLTAI